MGTVKRERQKMNRQQRLEELAKEARRTKSKRLGLRVGLGVPLIVLVLVGLAFIVNRDDDGDALDPAAATTTTTTAVTAKQPFVYGTAPCPAEDGSSAATREFAGPPAECIDLTKSYTALVETNKGSFTIALDSIGAPGNVNNFVALARYHYYDDSTCHRVIAGFVVQCGRPGDESTESAPGYSVSDELPVAGTYAEGVVAIANTGTPNTGGGQLFVITGEQGAALPNQYTVLGKVTEGYDTTVKALEALADPAASNGVPTLEPITITKVTITESDAPPTAVTPTTTTAPTSDATTSDNSNTTTTAG